MVPRAAGSPRSAQRGPRPGPRTRELRGGGRAGVPPGGEGQLRAWSCPSARLQATPALHSALEPGLCHLPTARLCPWEGWRRGHGRASSCQLPASLPPSPAPRPREQCGPFTDLLLVCGFSSIHRANFFALPLLSPTGLRTPSCRAFQRAASSRAGAAAGRSRLRDTRRSCLGFSVLQEPGQQPSTATSLDTRAGFWPRQEGPG